MQLLRRSPERRLGAGERDAEEVKRHLFFRVREKNTPNVHIVAHIIKKNMEAYER